MIQKSEDKTEEEKRIISELWAKTEKDDNEHGALLGGKIIKRVSGDNTQIDAKAWSNVVYYIYDNPKTLFGFYHTHTAWDSPLSWNDIATFLYIRNLHSLTAITEEHVYKITRTEKTPVIDYEDRKEIIKRGKQCFKEEEVPSSMNEKKNTLSEINDLYFFYLDAHREALCNATRQLAYEYNFIYEEEELK
jgi:hypothetical protein